MGGAARSGARRARPGKGCAPALRGTQGAKPGAAALALGLALIVSAFSGAAWAQTAEEDSVAKRAHPDYDPEGVQPDFLGSFILFPKVASGINYNDNVFADDTNLRADYFYTVTPSLSLRSDWDSHQVNLNANYNRGRYFEETSEDFEDFNFGGDGRLDTGLDSDLTLALSHQRSHESRGSPDFVGGAKPTKFFLSSGTLGGDYRGDALTLKPSFRTDRYNFLNNGTIDNDGRDRYEFTLLTRASYEASEGTQVFVEPSFAQISYDERINLGGVERSGTKYRVDVGLTLDISGVTFAEFSTGVLKRRFDDAIVPDADGIFGKGRLVWNPTDLSTLTASAERSINETTVAGASARIDKDFGLDFDHELLENFLINTNFGYTIEDFADAGRQDKLLDAGIALRYLMAPEVWWELRYSHSRRNSNEPGSDFRTNQVLLQLTLQR